MDGTVDALCHFRIKRALNVLEWVQYGVGKRSIGPFDFAVSWVRNILLRYGRQINDSVGDRVGSAESYDDSWRRGRMGDNDITAGVCK